MRYVSPTRSCLDFILLHRAHFDHILDAPYTARQTGATVIGHESSINVVRFLSRCSAKRSG